jgi:hypothetical protein
LSDSSARDYIPSKDRTTFESLIAAKDKEGLEAFLRFINMYGSTGYIARMRLSGLPLLTVALTLFFSVLATIIWFVGLYFPDVDGKPGQNGISVAIMDLAKLTLGAFIGSFVQRNVSEPAKAKSQDGTE